MYKVIVKHTVACSSELGQLSYATVSQLVVTNTDFLGAVPQEYAK